MPPPRVLGDLEVVTSVDDHWGEPTVHGTKVWPSTWVAMQHLRYYPLPRGVRGMDIGCGWGTLAAWCVKTFGAEMTCVDRDPHVIPYIQETCKRNDLAVDFVEADYKLVDASVLAGHRFIVGTDILFWDKLVDPLMGLVERGLEAGVERAVFVDPGRPAFWKFADEAVDRFGSDVARLGRMDYASGGTVEIRPKGFADMRPNG